MSIRKVWATRVRNATAEEFVGQKGTIFFNEPDAANIGLRVSDGETPGGLPISMPIATETTIGGLKLGPGVTLNAQNQLIIDTAGLDFSFGDFGSSIGQYTDSTSYALLQTVNPNEDAVIASNGTGKISIVGEFSVHSTNGSITGSLETDPIFRISSDGQVKILVPDTDSTAGAVEIIGSATGATVSPGQNGAMLHITGQVGDNSRFYLDGNGGYASIVGRRWNGTIVGGRTQVLANEDVLRINATAQTDAAMPNQAIAQIAFMALENQTATTQGSSIDFVVTPLGQPTANRVKAFTIKATGIELPVGGTTLKLAGATSGTISIQAAAIAGTNTITLPATTGTVITTGDTGTVTNTMLAGSIANNKLANSSVTVNGTTIALGASATVTAAAGTLTGTTLNSTVVTSSLTSVGTLTGLTVNGTGAFTKFTGKYVRNIRDGGTIGAGGTLTIDFSTDALVYCVWSDGMTLAYQNYTAGSVVRVMAKKATGTGTDTLSLGGITATQTSSGATSQNYASDVTAFIELTCTGTNIGSVYVKL